jgi:hypothetical protein
MDYTEIELVPAGGWFIAIRCVNCVEVVDEWRNDLTLDAVMARAQSITHECA